MFVDVTSFYEKYTPVGDILVMATAAVLMILIHTAYISRSRELRIIRSNLILLSVAAMINILYNIGLVTPLLEHRAIIYALKWAYQFCLLFVLYLYIMYMSDPLHQGDTLDKTVIWVSRALLLIVTVLDILGTVFRFGFYIDESLQIHKGINVFPVGYVLFIIILMLMIIGFKSKVFRPVLIGIVSSCLVAFLIMYVQAIFGQTSFTTFTYMFPTFAVIYFMHASAMDIEMGSASVEDFQVLVDSTYNRRKKFFIISLYMHDYDKVDIRIPKEITDKIRDYTFRFYKKPKIFKISGGRIVLMASMDLNPRYKENTKILFDQFRHEHKTYQQDYKLVVTESVDEISAKTDYIGLIEYIEKRMPQNDVHFINEKEVDNYLEHKYIVDQLADINEKKDLNDHRVLVFCQPVYNVKTGKYDTAESLMRLKLDKMGMVFPDRFIPIAEAHNYIHMLSMIILSKTCNQIKNFMENGYYVKRISVNFSMIDVRDDHFCFNVNQIVQDSGIPFDKVAIEITESQSEKDFMVVKEKIYELKQNGITFYLDDFGTGYSNFERIMELPFDIVKFDRSLVIASAEDKKSETMVTYLAHMFTDMNYTVLYEGIETDADQERCKKMFGRYLQGYKYSKPIPIEQLDQFFEKVK